MKKNDVTVIVCAFNAQKYIRETLDAIASQTYPHFDLLIVNDASTDDSLSVINDFLEGYSGSYEVVSFEENKGIAYGRHFAERYVETKYIIFVDSDDRPYSELVEKLYYKISSDSELVVVACYLEYINESGNKMRGGIFLGSSSKEEFYRRAERNKLMFLTCPTIYNRGAALSVGGTLLECFPEGQPRYSDFCEDLDLWTRMSDLYKEKKAIIVIPEVLCQYRKHVNSISSTNTYYMVLRMRHIKTNLMRRRSGKKEYDFSAFMASISEIELKKIKKYSDSAIRLRKSAYLFFDKKVVRASCCFIGLLLTSPLYVVEKIKSNLIK